MMPCISIAVKAKVIMEKTNDECLKVKGASQVRKYIYNLYSRPKFSVLDTKRELLQFMEKR